MSLPVPNLDDRRFQDLVDEAKRMIPRFCPEWTNHNLSDPGIALIELFAWMTEMVLFRVNQVPDAYYTRFLNLVGVEPYPPAAARTQLTFWLAGEHNHQMVVPVGSQVATVDDGAEPQVFSTLEDLVIAQPRLQGAKVSANGEVFLDVTEDLAIGRTGVSVFGTDQPRPGSGLYLAFAGSLAGSAIRLDINAEIEGIGVDPRQPPLRWELYADETWIAAEVHRDTTGGLNRRGEVVLLIPPLHEPMTLDGTRGFWLRVVLTEARPGQPSYQASPRLRAVQATALGGTVAAEHSEQVPSEGLGVSDGRAGQSFQLRFAPTLPRLRTEAVRVTTNGTGAESVTDWSEVGDFAESGPDDHHIVWDSVTGEIRFGPSIRYPDGGHRQHGAIPPAGADISVTGYRYGGGSSGNVGASTLIELRSAIPFVSSVTNLQPATGGVDAESIDNAKMRAPGTIRTGERAVTVADFERLAMSASPSVSRACCLAPTQPGGPVRLLIVPKVDRRPEELSLDDFALTDRLYDDLVNHLDSRRLLGATVEVGTPYYQGISVAVLIRALPGRPEKLVRQRALDALYRYINPFTGGADGQGWPFDADLNGASLYQLLGSIDGVDRVDEVVLFDYDLRNGQRRGNGLDVVRLAGDSLFLSAAHRIVLR